MEFKDYGQPVISLDIFVDEPSQTIHILDESPNLQVLISWFNECVQSRILNRLGESDEPQQWTWLCYNHDGFLTEYRCGFHNIPFDLYALYEPFAIEAKRRIQD